MVDICNPGNFANQKYPNQRELNKLATPVAYRYIKCFVLQAEGVANHGYIDDLQFWLRAHMGADGQNGTPVGHGAPTLEDRVEFLLNSVPLTPFRLPFDTTMDFFLKHPTRVVIGMRSGGFWRFPTDRHPLTMKHDYEDQYSDLQYHYIDSGGALQTRDLLPNAVPTHAYSCLSFTSAQPCINRGVPMRHGFSVNIDLVFDGGKKVLPISIDPDVENQGDPPTPPPPPTPTPTPTPVE